VAKQCQWRGGCEATPVPTERFCPLHRKLMLREMEQSGYLTPLPNEPPPPRPNEKRNERRPQETP
jgi:hypothetical protein